MAECMAEFFLSSNSCGMGKSEISFECVGVSRSFPSLFIHDCLSGMMPPNNQVYVTVSIYVTSSHVVRDAASRLPNGEGTRLDVRLKYM